MAHKAKFNQYQLRPGDHCLVLVGKRKQLGQVILRGKTYLSPIVVQLSSGKTVTFSSKEKSAYQIVAGARQVEGNWIAL